MNFLAHLLLTPPHPIGPAQAIGALLPDLHRGRLPDGLDPAVLAAAKRHRRVDALTDTHPVFAQTRDRLRPAAGRFAGVLTDLLYDHALSRQWTTHHQGATLEQFVEQCHAAITAGLDEGLAPQRSAGAYQKLIEQRWLLEYQDDAGLRRTLLRMSVGFARRFGREVDLTAPLSAVPPLRHEIDQDFEAIFQDLRRLLHQRSEPAHAAGA